MAEMKYEELSREELLSLMEQKDNEIQELRVKLAEQKRNREKIRRLQADGIRQAKDSGVRFGRPRKKITKEFFKYRKAYHDGEITLQEAAEKSHCSITTFRKWDKETAGEESS